MKYFELDYKSNGGYSISDLRDRVNFKDWIDLYVKKEDYALGKSTLSVLVFDELGELHFVVTPPNKIAFFTDNFI